MPESRSHETTAKRIARRVGAEYNPGKGVDIKSQIGTIEVETLQTVGEGVSQLRGHHGPVYIAGTNQATVQEALKATKGTTVGVMDKEGHIVKPSTRQGVV